MLAYAKGFAEQDAEVELCFLIGDKNRSRYEISIPGVKVVDFWQKDGLWAQRNRYVSLLENLARCKRYILPTDCVFVYGVEPYIAKMALKRTQYVYGEITEHPFMKDCDGKTKLSYSRLKLLNKLKGLFVISQSLRQYFIKRGVPENKVHISNMFVDSNRFEGLKKVECGQYFAYCGVVSKYKDGVDILIKAFAQFLKTHQDYRLYIIGRFESEDVRKDLETLAQSMSVSDRIVFTGQVSPNRMPDLLFNSLALVLARPNNVQSKYGFPTKLGEYLATGNPVIVTKVGEIGAFLKDRENAIVLPPDDANVFANGLAWVVEHPEEATLIGRRGRELALSEFSYKTQSKKVLDVMLGYSR